MREVTNRFIPPSNTRRRLGQVGFLHTFTICFPNHDAWYLVPQEELLNSANAKFYPHNSKSKARLEKYRDAFGLL